MADLWGNMQLGDEMLNDSKAVEILREQARLLGNKTNGKIKATFSRLEYKKTTTEVIGHTLLSLAGTKEEIVDTELEGKEDINKIYNFIKYKFEIFNDTYRFRVFILNYRPIFPIEIEADEGIKEELKLSSVEKISSDDELQGKVADIFASGKLQTIIRRMYAQK